MKKISNLGYIIFIICIIFIIWGALNPGFSRFYLAIPFFFISIFIARHSIKLIILSILIAIFWLFINATIFKNSIIFPILHNGTIEILENGYHQTFFDRSWSYTKEKQNYNGTLGDITYIPLTKWDIYNVTWISASAPDFGFTLTLKTNIWNFSENDFKPLYSSNPHIKLNKNHYSAWAKYWSYLMYWPLLFIAWFPIGFIFFWLLALWYLYSRKNNKKQS